MAEDSRPVVLNVDDSDSGRYLLTRLLTKEGYSVVEARMGQEALQLAERKPDIVLLDINLPDMTGLEVCRRLRAGANTNDIPVIHVSATAVSDADRIAGLECGADAYLVHPVEPGLLIATIRSMLRVRIAEKQARAAAGQWQTTFDSVRHGICLLDAEGRVIRANAAATEILGRTVEEVVGSTYRDVFRDEPAPEGGWPFERARVSGKREETELEARGRWYQITIDPLFGQNGTFAGAVRNIIDITDRKRHETEREQLLRQIESERARQEAVLQQMPAALIIAEAPSGRHVMSNEQVARMAHGPSKPAENIEEYGKLWKLTRPDGRPYPPEDLPLARAILKGEVITNEEMEFQRGDGTKGRMLASAAPVRDHNGFIVAGVLAMQDISERKQLEDQFRQSQKMEAIGRLAGGVAHDFNNLLTIMGGYGQMILDGLDPNDPLRKDLEAITEAAGRASALTKQLLTVSRRQVVQPKVFDLNRLIARMNRMLRRVIGEDVELSTILKSDRSRIKADPGQIEQVILNLAVNARDAMPKGGKLTIETADVEIGEAPPGAAALQRGRYVLLAVGDSGTGMPPEVMAHVFEPFFTTKPKGKGTGLGLSTAYGIVKQAGGEIVVDSEAGRGSTFRIYLPGVERSSERAAEVVTEVTQARRGTETILLVEDENDVRRLTAEMLARQGYNVIEAASGHDALRAWDSSGSGIDLLLTDIVMPKMSGQELAQHLRNFRPDLKIMYMSGYTDDVVASHGSIEATTLLLQKPFTSDTLARMVRHVLDMENQRTADGR